MRAPANVLVGSMDLSPVSLVSPEPSAPAKSDVPAPGAPQFDDLLAAGAAAPAPRQAPQPPAARVQDRAPDRSRQASTDSRPAAPTNTNGSSDNSSSTNAADASNSGSSAGSSQ